MRARARTRIVVASALLVGTAALVPGGRPAGAAPVPIAAARAADPVVVSGAKVPTLKGARVGDIVAFRWAAKWVQVPVQVNQRKQVELNTVYGNPANTSKPVKVVVYADPKTFTGGGSGKLGALDEIAFMARDTGTATPPSFREPSGVVRNSGVRIAATDPLTGAKGYVYLFRRASTKLVPGAGKKYVTYTFKLLSGGYKATYDTVDGPNAENTTVSSAHYARHFGDRWLDDAIRVKTGGATGVDVVDRHKALFAPGSCGRSEDTFDDAEGAFVANLSGPVRAIRSYIGANSGPYTQRTHVFYERREDIVTDLRVHPIPSVMDFWDYSPAAAGMQYTNSSNVGDVPVDGAIDTLTSGAPDWEKIDGPQGSLTHVWRLVTNASGVTRTNWYEDNATNPSTQCTGDAFAYGASGQRITSSIPNTDPHIGAAAKFQARETLYFEAPNRPTSAAQAHTDQIAHPLILAAQRYQR
jgi:hypothetical protein